MNSNQELDVCTWKVETQDVTVCSKVKGRLKEWLCFRRNESDASALFLM